MGSVRRLVSPFNHGSVVIPDNYRPGMSRMRAVRGDDSATSFYVPSKFKALFAADVVSS